MSDRERALWALVDASHVRDEDERRPIVLGAADVLTTDEMYLGSLVIALFNFYNTFVDVNGVARLTAEGYEASGHRLAAQGYPMPPTPPPPTPTG